jgi:ABC-type multidrug transport system fused ATPase/permease subunit
MVLGFISAYNGEITGGDFVAFVILLGKITEPMSEFPVLMAAYKEAAVCVKRINQIYQSEEETNGSYTLSKEHGEYKGDSILRFNGVNFGYREEEIIIKNLSFQVPKHHIAAFVGASGSGKSSLFKIICKLYDSQSGDIHFLGKSLKNWENEALREQIAYVPQDVFLFPCSIADNIGFGRPGASREEIVEMAKLAQAHEFILQLPEGYETNAGERGIKLSGGQRQRIAIARAFLKDAPVLLLDEMTSALDGESERLLQQALKSYSKKRTVLMIAHRLSTIIDADEIYVLENGAIAEQGKHKELIEKNGAYKRLYTKQLGEDTKDEVNIERVC